MTSSWTFPSFSLGRILELAEFTLKNPANEGQLSRIGNRDVVARLPALLRRVAFTLDWLPRACDLLWHIGRDDDRPLNSNPDHGLRVLADLSSYELDKPYAYNTAVIRCLERWARAPEAGRYIEKTCDIIDPILKKIARASRMEGAVVTLTACLIDEQLTRSIRDRAIRLLEGFLESDNPKDTLRVIKSLRSALNDPTPEYGMQITHEQHHQWVSEQLHTLGILERQLTRGKFAIARLRAFDCIRWAARYSRNPDVRERALQLRDSFSPDQDLKLTELLAENPQGFWEDDYNGDVGAALERRAARFKESSLLLAEHIIQLHPDPVDGLRALSAYLDPILLEGEFYRPVTFLSVIGELSLDYSRGLCEAILQSPEHSLVRHFDLLLAPVRRRDPAIGHNLLCRALNSEHKFLWLSVASVFYNVAVHRCSCVCCSVPGGAQPPLPTKDDCRSVAGYLNCIHIAQPDLRLCSWMSLLACGFGDFPVRSDPASFLAHRLFLHSLRPQATASAARCRQTTPRPPPPGTRTPIAPAVCRSRSPSRFVRTSGLPVRS